MAKVEIKHGSAAEDPSPQNSICSRACCWSTFTTLGLILTYFSLSIGLTFFQRSLLKGFHFPLTVSVCHMSVKFMFAGLCRTIWSCYTSKEQVHLDWRNYLTKVMPMGFASGLDIGFSNWGLEFITVSLYTMTKSTSIVFILGFALLFKLEKKSCTLVGIVVSISIGLFLFTYKATQFVLLGFLLVLTASFISGLRWTLAQLVIQKSSLGLHNPLDMLYHVQPLMIVAILPFAVAFEGTSLAVSCRVFRFMDVHILGHTILSILIGALLAFSMEISEYMVVTHTSSLTLSVASIVKEICTLVLAVEWSGDQMSSVNVVGLMLCLGGIVFHVLHKLPTKGNSNTEDCDNISLSSESRIPLLESEASVMFNASHLSSDSDSENSQVLFDILQRRDNRR